MSKSRTKLQIDEPSKNQCQIDSKTEAVFRRKNYRILNKLGAGAFGIVYKAERLDSTDLSAVKVLELTKMSVNYRSKFLPRELQALIETKHENIVDVFDIIRANKRIYIFMEFMGGGDIAGYVRKNNGVKITLGCMWFLQVSSGLSHLHDQLFMCHRDIKLDNMLLSEQRIAKLSDFGFARTSFDPSTGQVIMSNTYCGTLPYYCPQLLQKKPYDPFKADVWAMGISLYIILENRFPFHYKDKAGMLEEMKQYPNYLRTRFQQTPKEARRLLESMLNPNEQERAVMSDIHKYQWLQKIAKS